MGFVAFAEAMKPKIVCQSRLWCRKSRGTASGDRGTRGQGSLHFFVEDFASVGVYFERIAVM